MTRRLLDKRTTVEAMILAAIPPAPVKVSIVLDCWSAPRREGYIAIKAYWISDSWKMTEALIGFEPVFGNHSGQSLGEVVLKRLELFQIASRIIALTSDNASNNTTLTETLNTAIVWLYKRLGIQRSIAQIPCLAHVIQLAVQQLLGKIKIAPTNDDFMKNWIEDEEIRQLEIARGTLAQPHRVSFMVVFMVVHLNLYLILGTIYSR